MSQAETPPPAVSCGRRAVTLAQSRYLGMILMLWATLSPVSLFGRVDENGPSGDTVCCLSYSAKPAFIPELLFSEISGGDTVPLGVPALPKKSNVLVVPKAARAMPLAGTLIAAAVLTRLLPFELPAFEARIGLLPFVGQI